MPYYVNRIQNGTELYHHGIFGQRWGVRRFQNKDGTLTAEGKKRYLTEDGRVRYGIKGMRKGGASTEERIARGEALTKQGSSIPKAVLAYIGRNYVQELVMAPASIGSAALAAVTPIGMAAVGAALTGATYLQIQNLRRTIQDVSDIRAYRKSLGRDNK